MAPTPTAAAAPAALDGSGSPAASFFKVAEFSPDGAPKRASSLLKSAAAPARAPSAGIGSNGRPAAGNVSSAPRGAPAAAAQAAQAPKAPEPAKKKGGFLCCGKPRADEYRLPAAAGDRKSVV